VLHLKTGFGVRLGLGDLLGYVNGYIVVDSCLSCNSRASKTCLDMLNLRVERHRSEIDDDVLPFTRTNDVGYATLSIPDSGSANGIILYRPTILCSTRGARRTDDVRAAGFLWRAGYVRAIVLWSVSCVLMLCSGSFALAPAWRVSLRTMPPHLLIAQF
jgi:hypothetical protein